MTNTPIARHIRRGTTYDIIGRATVQTKTPLRDMEPVVVYRCRETGVFWVRNYDEFYDGRFEIVLTAVATLGEKK